MLIVTGLNHPDIPFYPCVPLPNDSPTSAFNAKGLSLCICGSIVSKRQRKEVSNADKVNTSSICLEFGYTDV